MNSIVFRKLYDFYVLKPFWLLFIVLTVFYLYHQDWLSGIFFALVWWFGIGGIGGKLYPEMSPKELAKGTKPSREEIANAGTERPSLGEVHLISKAHMKLSALIGFSAIVILWHYDLRWYLVIALGLLFGLVLSLLIFAYLGVVYYFSSKKLNN